MRGHLYEYMCVYVYVTQMGTYAYHLYLCNNKKINKILKYTYVQQIALILDTY